MNIPQISKRIKSKITIAAANQTIKIAKFNISESRLPQIELSAIRGNTTPTLQDKLSSIK